jgi:hypothetical protein
VQKPTNWARVELSNYNPLRSPHARILPSVDPTIYRSRVHIVPFLGSREDVSVRAEHT